MAPPLTSGCGTPEIFWILVIEFWRTHNYAFQRWPGTSNRPTEAIDGRLEQLRGSALGVRNLDELHRQITARVRKVQTATTPSSRMSRYERSFVGAIVSSLLALHHAGTVPRPAPRPSYAEPDPKIAVDKPGQLLPSPTRPIQVFTK